MRYALAKQKGQFCLNAWLTLQMRNAKGIVTLSQRQQTQQIPSHGGVI